MRLNEKRKGNIITQATQDEIEIKKYEPLRAEIEAMKARNSALVFQYDTPAGNKNARSHVYKMRQKKAHVERVRKEAKAYALEYGRKVDDVAKVLAGELDSMIAVHQEPLDEIEKREQQKREAEERRIAEEKAEAERKAQAERDAIIAAERAEAARVAAELAALRRKQEDERIAREAAENARIAAEQKAAKERAAQAKAKAEQDAKDAAARAETEKAAAVQRAIDAEAKRAKEAKALEAARIKAAADAESARLKRKAVREKIIRNLSASIVSVCEIPQSSAESIATAILDGKIDGVTYAEN